MDYISGDTLRKIINKGEKPDRPTFENIARALMEGVRALHENIDDDGNNRAIIHGDIKPDNIIITPTNKPVIIDLGLAGLPRVELYQGTSPYVPPYSIRGADREFSQRCDLFALGITLWEWLFAERPYRELSVGNKPMKPEILPDFQDLYPWLVKAVSTEPEKGFTTIKEMWDMFNKAEPTGMEITVSKDDEEISEISTKVKRVISEEDGHCPFVAYLNTLAAITAGNENAIAENQIQNKFFPQIHVPNPFSDEIYKLLSKGRSIILTGNAGDGKTTIAIDVLKMFRSNRVHKVSDREEIPKHNLVVIKDMSELPPAKHTSILLEALENTNTKYLIVSNTGTLLNAFKMLDKKIEQVPQDQNILAALEAREPLEIANGRFLLMNIGQLDSIGTACRVFRRMIESENWNSCSKCKILDSCIIYRNISLLRNNLERVLGRIYYLYKRLFEYGNRLTMRQMTGHLAYALTGGLDCKDLFNMSLLARRSKLSEAGFSNWFFGDDGSTGIPKP